MEIICKAVIENPLQRENLCKCVNILGGVPCIHKNLVCVSLSRADAGAEKIIELFEQFPRHEIQDCYC